MTRKQKAESKTHENEQSPKKVKSEDENGRPNGKSEGDRAADEFEEFCKATRESLSIDQMREILQMNDQDSTGPDSEVASKWYIINTDNMHLSFFLRSFASFFFLSSRKKVERIFFFFLLWNCFDIDSQDLLFYGALEICPVCSGKLVFDGKRYSCNGFLSEWSTCTFKTKDPPRKNETSKLPESVLNSPASDVTLHFLHLASSFPG